MKKVVLSSVALFVASMLLGFLIHGMLLHGEYDGSGLMRSAEEQESMFGFMVLGHVLIAIGMTLIYRRGRQDKPWLGQGIRFGLLWAFATSIPTYLIYYVVRPYELDLVLKQMALDTVGITVLGVIAACVNRD